MKQKLDHCIKNTIPCIVISDFEAQKVEVYTIEEAKKEGILFAFKHATTYKPHNLTLSKKPLSFESYKTKFDSVIEEIKKGNTYLLNLTQPTVIETDATLKEIFYSTNASYKILYKDRFVCFSPESFIQIQGNTIATFPMKGTIDASLPNAKEKILHDEKEMAEHVMIVDLLRNDLGIIASEIRVKQFRYITEVKTNKKTLLQVSSKITAKLPQNWRENFSEFFFSLLPAGSITGTPKKKTTQLIKEIEGYERGFFSGVFGYFDGKNFDSCVMIRFIEKDGDSLIYKSGGGITLLSDVKAEYNELLDKVYLP